jgi:hypothetical protein
MYIESSADPFVDLPETTKTKSVYPCGIDEKVTDDTAVPSV